MADPWYVSLFRNYAKQYDKESYTQGTLGECDFIEQELDYDKTLRILDVGCGTGRHSIELAKRGYNMTGVDFSEAQLRRAKEKAQAENLIIPFLLADARCLPFEEDFDAAIMLCEGGFPLMETDRENAAILASVAKSLKPDALLIFTTLNGLYPLTNSLNDFYANNAAGGAAYESDRFDIVTMRDRNVTTFLDDDQKEHTIHSNERYYLPSEITWLLSDLGFIQVEFFGAHLGNFSREHKLTSQDFEMLVVAYKHHTANALVQRYTAQVQQSTIPIAYSIILNVLKTLHTTLETRFPEVTATSLYQGYMDMSYVGLVTPELKSHDLKLAIVYVHATGCFELWLAARNRTIQDQYREKLRGKVKAPFQLVEKEPVVDAIVQVMLDEHPNYDDQSALVATLCDRIVGFLGDIHAMLAE
jgi:SAM-dependent methyltransferase